jgi:hypothetical protein
MGVAKGTASAPTREHRRIRPVLSLHSSATQPLPCEAPAVVQES